jgi:tetratricopeptide (TPR) repeat protein
MTKKAVYALLTIYVLGPGLSIPSAAQEAPLGPTPLARAAALTEKARQAASPEESRRLIHGALREDEKYAPALILRGLLDLEAKAWGDARDSFEEVIQHRPSSFEAQNNLGYAYLREMVEKNRLGDPEQAAAADRAFLQAQKEASQEPAPLWNRGVLLYLLGREAEALQQFDLSISRGPNLRMPRLQGKELVRRESSAAPGEVKDPARLRELLAVRNEGGGEGTLGACPRRALLAHLKHQWTRVAERTKETSVTQAPSSGPGFHERLLGALAAPGKGASAGALAESAAGLALMDVQLIRDLLLKDGAYGGAMDSR